MDSNQDRRPAVAEPEPSGLGTCAHVRATLERARAAIRASHEHTARSRDVLARAAALSSMADRTVVESAALSAQLRASVSAYVRHLRADGVPSEKMLVLVKTVVREATPPELDAYEARALMEAVVRWSVDAYFQAA